jgi:hypothetical protein
MTRRIHAFGKLLGLAAIATLLLALVTHHNDRSSTQPTQTAALRQLGQLQVLTVRPHHPGYERGCAHGQACSFGPAWTDNTTAPGGHNSCDTRNDVLAAQLADVAHRAGSRCVVVAGVLHDPYSGTTIRFTKQHASAVQIDHIVPLALAWDLGAYAWPQARRATYANDERLVLLAVDGAANEAKGDAGPAEWMPSNGSYRATYAARFVAVLTAYHLPVTAADKAALAAALKGTR